MNQFRLDLDATRCAQAHQDAHCGKMLCELMQQACTAFPEPRSTRLRFPDTVNISDHVENVLLVEHDPQTEEFVVPWGACAPPDRAAVDLLPYAHTHRNHPCAVWTRATRANFDSTIELAQALAVEFRHRFGKPHGSEAALDWVVRHRAEAQVPDGPLTPYVLAMPEEYQQSRAFFCTGCKSLFNHPVNARVSCETCKRLLWPCDNTTDAYRAYYRAEKRGHWRKSRDPSKPSTWVPAKWTRRDPPEWF